MAAGVITTRMLLLATAAVLVMTGCGQKGPLYLPDRNPSVVGGSVPPPAQSRLPVPAPAPQPQAAPEQTIPGSPAQPLVTPGEEPRRDARLQPPPKKDRGPDESPDPQ